MAAVGMLAGTAVLKLPPGIVTFALKVAVTNLQFWRMSASLPVTWFVMTMVGSGTVHGSVTGNPRTLPEYETVLTAL
jgi:hypothetical protein